MKKKLSEIRFIWCIPFFTSYWRQITLILLLISQFSSVTVGQIKQWDKTIGGDGYDYLYSVQQTKDGGYILGGESYANISGDKSENSIEEGDDYWIVKLKSDGSKAWDKTLGGTGYDRLMIIQQTKDGGYILAGVSDSDRNDYKSENSRGDLDYWIVKLKADGSVQWDKTFGGNFDDELTVLQQTRDGGYIIGGVSDSDIGADKSEADKGYGDYWIIKLTSDGSKEWDRTIGGNFADYLSSILQTSDGGYILGGESTSDKSGDRTEDSRGWGDYWIVKLDATGKKVWDKAFGGNDSDVLSSMAQTSDGGLILGGSSASEISGDKTEAPKQGSSDYWLVKLNADGTKAWDKVVGGNDGDQLVSLAITQEGGYLLGGHSHSGADGDKSEEKDRIDLWVVMLDAKGNKAWDRTFGTSSLDVLTSMTLTTDGGVLLGAHTDAEVEGDKTESSRGGEDYWVIKLAIVPNVAPTDISITDTLAENMPAYTSIGTFTTTDADNQDTHLYTLIEGNDATDNEKFSIIDNELWIHHSPDYETQSIYHIRVKTNDLKAYGTYEKTLSIGVKNINEAPSGITLTPQTVDENNEKGAHIGLLFTMDQDAGDNHTYTLIDGVGAEDNASFSIVGNQLKAAQSFDYEIKNSFTIRLQVKDSGNLTYETSKVITINDLSDAITGLAEEKSEALKVYPNPTSQFLQISYESKIDAVTLVNSFGAIVLIKKANSEQIRIDTDSLNSGIYTALVYSNGIVYTQRITIIK